MDARRHRAARARRAGRRTRAVVNADIAMAIAEARSTYDLVLLDVDNGPGYLVHEANEAVYETQFLHRCREVLAPGGVLVIWSANAAPDLLAAMREVFGEAEEQAHDVLLQERPEHYFLYLARADLRASAQERLEHRSGRPGAGLPGLDEDRHGQVALGRDHPGVRRQVARRVRLAVLRGAGLGDDLAGHVEQEAPRPGRHHRPQQLRSVRASRRGQRRGDRRLLGTWCSGSRTGSTARPARHRRRDRSPSRTGRPARCPARSGRPPAPVSVSGGGTWPK